MNTEEITHQNTNQSSDYEVFISQLKDENVKLTDEVIDLKTQLDKKNKTLKFYEEQLEISRQRKFAASSESLKQLQPTLFDGQKNILPEEEIAEEKEEPEETIDVPAHQRKVKKKGRKLDTSKLERETIVYDLTDEEKTCDCGNHLTPMDPDKSEQVEFIPAKLFVKESIRHQYSCKHCNTVKMAEKPAAPIPKCMAAPSLLSAVVINKYQYHLPLYRQSKMFMSRGFDIPDNTLGNWVLKTAEVLSPLGEALWACIEGAHYLQADETPVKVLSENKKAYMWCYQSLDSSQRLVSFDFSLSRGKEQPNFRLANFKGLLQTDGYAGYNDLRKKKTVLNFGCMAHVRRKFMEIVKLNPKKPGTAHVIVGLIKKLYDIEKEARNENLTTDERKNVRQSQAKPIIDKIYKQLLKSQQNASAQSALGKAIKYALNQWEQVIRYIEYGEAEIDNNLTENQIRPFAIGRKNWLFVGNEVSGKKGALLYSLIQSCLLHKIEPYKYLTYVLSKAHEMRKAEIDSKELLPHLINRSLFES